MVAPRMNLINWKRFFRTFLLALLAVWIWNGFSLSFSPTMARESHHGSVEQNNSIVQSDIGLASTLYRTGNEHYLTGNYAQAIDAWQQAADLFVVNDDPLHHAMAVSNLALAHSKQGDLQQANQLIDQALQQLRSAASKEITDNSKAYGRTLAQATNTLGTLQLAQGQAEQALITWQQAADLYNKTKDSTGILRTTVNQAQALISLGFYPRAHRLLLEAEQQWQNQPDSIAKATAFISLGNTLRLVGSLEESDRLLSQGLSILQTADRGMDYHTASISNLQHTALLGLANTARARQKIGSALAYYQQAASIAPAPLHHFEADVNQLSLLLDTIQLTGAARLWPALVDQAPALPPSRPSILARLNLVDSLYDLRGFSAQNLAITGRTGPPLSSIEQLVDRAWRDAETLKDPRILSYGFGYRGRLAEERKEWQAAEVETTRALELSSDLGANDISYRWLWQLGRIYKQQAKAAEALDAYGQAVKLLQVLRYDIAAGNPDVQFSFRSSIEPLYREYVDLLTDPSRNVSSAGGNLPTASPANLELARQAMETLTIAELNDYFQQACLEAKPVNLDTIDSSAAVIYPISLPNRLEVIVSLPGQPLSHYPSYQADSGRIYRSIQQLQQALVQDPIRRQQFNTTNLLPHAQELYGWIIPMGLEKQLRASDIKTLVFVLDGPLRSLPMAVLHDGKNYLGSSYGIAVAPGLQLLEPPQQADQAGKVLLAGLTEAKAGFSALPYVDRELNEIGKLLPHVILRNNTFTTRSLGDEITASSFPIVHLATHGQFSSNPESTFLLTSDGRIGVNEFDRILQSTRRRGRDSLHLLVLSACQTAAGDDKAVLGLAGMAIKSGASSTLATLWPVSDQATAEFMKEFYRVYTGSTVSEAEALRQAQQALMANPEYQHPYFWSSYTLVGNWQ